MSYLTEGNSSIAGIANAVGLKGDAAFVATARRQARQLSGKPVDHDLGFYLLLHAEWEARNWGLAKNDNRLELEKTG